MNNDLNNNVNLNNDNPNVNVENSAPFVVQTVNPMSQVEQSTAPVVINTSVESNGEVAPTDFNTEAFTPTQNTNVKNGAPFVVQTVNPMSQVEQSTAPVVTNSSVESNGEIAPIEFNPEGFTPTQINNIPKFDVEEDPNKINTDMNSGLDQDGVYVDEKLKSVEINYKPPSKGRVVLLLFLFMFLILFVLILPDVVQRVSILKTGEPVVEEITTGKLICTLESDSKTLSKIIERTFYYENSELQKATYKTTIRGDVDEDEKEMNALADKCADIKDATGSLSGIDINCSYSEGLLVETEKFDFQTYDSEKVRAAYVESGGDILEYSYKDDIDNVMVEMRRSGFTCNKEK